MIIKFSGINDIAIYDIRVVHACMCDYQILRVLTILQFSERQKQNKDQAFSVHQP